jgi:hypothetical protein
MSSNNQYHFLIETSGPAGGRSRRLEVPSEGPSSLTFTDPPRILPGVPAGPDRAVLEAVRHEGRTYLAMVLPPDHSVRINSAPAPRVATLQVGDRVRLGAGPLLHLALYNRPAIGPPGPEMQGKVCPVCRLPLSGDTTVYTCAGCGAGLHCEGPERDDQDRLECVRICSACPTCTAPINLTEGYLHDPSSRA